MRIDPGTADKILDIVYNHNYEQASSAEVAQALHMQPEETESIFFGLEKAVPALIKANKDEDGCYIRINTDHYLQFWGFIDTGGFTQHPELLQPHARKYRNGIFMGLITAFILLLIALIAYLSG